MSASSVSIVSDLSDFEVFSSGGVGATLGDMGVGDTGAGSPNLGRRSLVRFDLSGLVAPVSEATLRLTILQSRQDQYPAGITDSTPPFINPGLGNTMVIHVADYETPDNTDYGSPSIGNDPGILIPAEVEPGAQVSIEVTAAVNQALGAAASYVAFRIQTATETDADSLNDVWFLASANNTEASAHPVLEIGDESSESLSVDIKPDSELNPINLKSKGVIPVAILGSEEFDVMMIDWGTLAFGHLGAPIAHKKVHFGDVNDDGFKDLIAHFRTQETGILEGDTEACLVGELMDGTPIQGCDAIKTVP